MKVALAWVQGFNTLDIKAIAAQYSDSLQHYILPASLGRPVRGKQEWTEWFASMIPMFEKLEVSWSVGR